MLNIELTYIHIQPTTTHIVKHLTHNTTLYIPNLHIVFQYHISHLSPCILLCNISEIKYYRTRRHNTKTIEDIHHVLPNTDKINKKNCWIECTLYTNVHIWLCSIFSNDVMFLFPFCFPENGYIKLLIFHILEIENFLLWRMFFFLRFHFIILWWKNMSAY